MEIKSFNTKLRQGQMSKEIGCSNSTVQRYKQVINLLSPYKIQSNSHKGRQNLSNINLDDNSNRELGLKKTSNDLKLTSKEPITNIQSKLKGGSMQEIGEINDEELDEICRIILNFKWN